MGATFSRLKNWTTEILTDTDLNAEIDNILNNLGPAGVDDYSSTATQMRIQTSPGALGSESLATSLAGEIERLRYVIQRIIGSSATYWYQAPLTSISDIIASLGSSGLPVNRISSGRTTGNSSQLCALIPSGSTNAVTLSASVTPFIYYIANTQYSITANVTLSGLSTAAGTNNTASFNDTSATGQQWTKFLGQYGTDIPMSAAGSGITALTASIVGFQTGSTEYFLAYVASSGKLRNAWRGSTFDSSANGVAAKSLTHAQEIKLLKLAWIFANTNSSLAVTYNNPVISANQPSSPAVGDYWMDMNTTAWKTFNSTTWVAANATLIGLTLQNTAACVAARTFDAYTPTSDKNTLVLEQISNTVVQAKSMFGEARVFSTGLSFSISRPTWDITTDLEAGLTETLSTNYFMYLKESGDPLISDKAPMNRPDLGGLYYPTETWRCFGSCINDASSNFETPARTFSNTVTPLFLMGGDPTPYDAELSTNVTIDHVALIDPINYKFSHSLGTPVQWLAGSARAYIDITNVTLSPGVWSLSAALQSGTPITTAGTWLAKYAIGEVQGTAAFIEQPSYNTKQLVFYGTAGSTYFQNVSFHDVIAMVTTSTTYYLKYMSDQTNAVTTGASAGIQSWWLFARKIDSINGYPGW